MNVLPILARITVYPVKALDPLPCEQTVITEGGALLHDREFAMFDPEGKYVNGKRNPRVHLLRSTFDVATGTMTVDDGGGHGMKSVLLPQEKEILEEWLGGVFGFPVVLRQDTAGGFPDDTHASGPTLVSTATLECVASWFDGLTIDDVRRRFRPNLEISGVPPFWEDRLFTDSGAPVDFRIGGVGFKGIRPCSRCVVPTRDPVTARVYQRFQTTFMEKRRETLPAWSPRSRFDHFYRMCVNTRIDPGMAGRSLSVGDPLTMAFTDT